MRCLIINPFGIGDVLFTTPVVYSLHQADPQGFIGYWCNERVKSVLGCDPAVNTVFPLSRGDLKKIYGRSWREGVHKTAELISWIRRGHFDVSLDFSLDHRYSLLAAVCGVKKRIGFNYKNRGWPLTHRVDINGYSDKHAVLYYLDLLKFLGIQPGPTRLHLYVSAESRARGKSLIQQVAGAPGAAIIGIAPGAGASWGKDASVKQWAPLRFAQLATRLIEETGAKIVLLGDESERPIADIIVGAMRQRPLNLIGRTSLGDLAGCIEQLSVLVTNDGGPLHMGVALGIKTVSVFGPVDDLVYGPYPPSADHVVLKKDLPCRPCYRNFRLAVCDKDRECIKSITVSEAFETVQRLL